MDRLIKLSVKIKRELPFISSDEIQMFLDNHSWIEEKYESTRIFDLNNIYDDLIEYLESKRDRYASL